LLLGRKAAKLRPACKIKKVERIPAQSAAQFSHPKMVRRTKIKQTRHGAKFAVIYGWMISNAFAKNNDSHQPEG
jgi:hypothetical protein